MSKLLKTIKILEEIDFLRGIPVVLLKMVATYACIGPIEGRLVGVAKFGSSGSEQGPFVTVSSSIVGSESTGELLVLDCEEPYVKVISMTDLSLLRSWGSFGSDPGQLFSPESMCIYETTGRPPRVLVTDLNDRVQELQLDGTFIRFFGNGRGSQPGQLWYPWGVAVSSAAGIMYVSEFRNHRISVFSLEDGRFVRSFGSCGNGDLQFNKPSGIYFDEEHKLLLVADSGNGRVKIMRSDGSLVRILDVGTLGKENPFTYLRDVSVEGEEVIVTDRWNHRIQAFSLSTGQPLRRFGSEGSGDGQFKGPSGIWRDSRSGRLYVTDQGSHRISVFE